jgi:sialidase-1
MIGINDLGDNNNSANQVVADLGTLVDQLRAANPNVRIHLNRLLYTNQSAAMKTAVDSVNNQLQALADARNAASSSSPVWVIDAATGFDPVTMTYDNVHPNTSGETYVGDRIAAALGLLETPEAPAVVSGPPPHVESDSATFPAKFEGNEIWNGSAFANSWTQTGTLTKSLPATTDLKAVNPGSGGAWIEGTNSGWNTGNNGSWTLETRLKFTANANGFILWLGTDNDTILVEIYGDRTQDSGNNTFNAAHNNLDGNFHTFRVANDSINLKYHVWRDGIRLTPVAGVAYDNTNNESRLIMGDYTSAAFGNNFDVTIDHVRFDLNGAWLPPGTDADGDGLRDAWEYQYFGSITSAVAGNDEDGDGKTNLQEAADGTDPWMVNASVRTLRIFILTGGANALGEVGTTDTTMRFPPPGTHAAEGVPFFWNNRADGTPAGDAALGDSGGAWVNLGPQTGGYYAGNDDHFGPEIGFSRMLWNSGHRDYAIVKVAGGGGGNTLWQKGSVDDHMYQHLLGTVNAAVATLPAGFDEYEIAGLLHVQGEGNDATEAAEAGNRFSTLIADLKSDLAHASSLVGVFGEIAGTGTNRDTTRTNQLALATSRSDIGYAESTGLAVHNQDGLSLHYDAESQILLGERMAAEIITLGSFATKPLPAWSNLHTWFVADNGMTFDSAGAVNRWAGVHNGGAVRDLARRVSGQTFQRDVTAGNGAARKVMHFDGTNDLWSNATTEFGAISGARSVAILCRATNANDGYLFDGSTGTGRTRAQIRAGKWQAGVATAWDEADSDTATQSSGVWQQHVFTFSNSVADTTVKHWIDGVLISTTTDTGTANLGGFIIGSNGGSPFARIAADVAEIAVYNTALGVTEIATLKTAWDARWGTPALPPFSAAVVQTPREIPRFGRHDVLKLELNSQAGTATTLNEIRVEIAPGSRSVTKRWALYSGGDGSVFNPSSTPIAVIDSPVTDTLVFPVSLALAEGANVLWIAAEPVRYAPLGSSIDARLLDLTTSGAEAGTFVPANADPTGVLNLALVPLFNDVRVSGEGGVTTYRIPGIVSDTSGVLHAVYDHRYNGGGDLPANIDVGYSRSTDGGATWTASQVIMDYDSSVVGSSGNGVGDPCILHDPVTDTLWVAALWSFGNHGYSGSGPGTDPTQTGQYVLTKSTDGGLTWSAPINITVDVKDDTNWRLVFQGPGHGFAMRNGTLVFPSQRINTSGVVQSCSVFSTDHGATWDFGSAVTATSPTTNENTACELDDGRLLFSMRTPSGSNGQRAWAHYTPGGTSPMRDGSWNPLYRLAAVPDPVCQGSVVQWTSRHRGDPREFVVFGNPASSSSRTNFSLRVSPDGGSTWPVSRMLYAGSGAYSSICILPDKSIGVLLEKDNYTRITFARVEADWLLNPAADADGDGMPDAWELLYQLNPAVNDANPDNDGDGMNNVGEYQAGTDPESSSSLLRATTLAPAPGGWSFGWQAVPGMTYAIETSADLTNWNSVGEVLADTSGEVVTIPAASGENCLFFRARVLR